MSRGPKLQNASDELLRQIHPRLPRSHASAASLSSAVASRAPFLAEPRATNDIDFVVSMTRVRAFAEALGPDFEVDQIILRDALATGGSANISDLSRGPMG